MSRSGYSEDGGDDNWAFICYRGAVNSAIKGNRGQNFLRYVLDVLDAMPVKELVANDLEADGKYCTLGAVGAARGFDLSKIDTENWPQLSGAFNIAETLAREIMWINDESVSDWSWDYALGKRLENTDIGAKRWVAVRKWVIANIITESTEKAAL
jgi:hypothetical protein